VGRVVQRVLGQLMRAATKQQRQRLRRGGAAWFGGQ
jgi:hypothetical protein